MHRMLLVVREMEIGAGVVLQHMKSLFGTLSSHAESAWDLILSPHLSSALLLPALGGSS